MEAATTRDSEVLAHAIRAAGLKVTAQRLTVLDVLQRSPHSSAEQVFANLRSILPGTSVQAVYGILAAFTRAGLTRRLDPPGSPALFECRVGDNHHHIVCVECDVIMDVDCVIGAAPCLVASDDFGFTVFAAEVTFTGLCSKCRGKAPAAGD